MLGTKKKKQKKNCMPNYLFYTCCRVKAPMTSEREISVFEAINPFLNGNTTDWFERGEKHEEGK